MVRRTGALLIALGLMFGTGQSVFAQAQSASSYIQPTPASVKTGVIQPTATQPPVAGTAHTTAAVHGGCNTGNCGSTFFKGFHNRSIGFGGSLKSVFDRARLDYNRNAAWPQPFVIADRAAYQGFIQPCIDRGWEIQNTLADDCFDGRSGRLNRLGAAKIRNVVHSAPISRKSVFVYSSGPTELVSARIKEVQAYLTYEFGRSNNVSVAATKNYPHGGRGIYAEHIVPKYFDALPTPALDGSSVSSAVNGGN